MFEELERRGAATAIVADGRHLTFAELADAADELERSWGPGRHLVMIVGSNTIDSVTAWVATQRHGHVAIFVAPEHTELRDSLMSHYRPDILLAAGGTTIRSDGPPPMHDDLALLATTSGSTGSPRLVRLSKMNLRANATAIIEYLGITHDERAITTLPLFYSYGLSVVTTHLEAGASIILTDLSVADPCLWELATIHRATSFAGVPYTFELLDQGRLHASLPKSLRTVTVAGGALSPERVTAWATRGRDHGFDLVVMYGQAEATTRMAYVPPDRILAAPDAMGQAIPGGSLRLEPVPESSEPGVGELIYSGDNVMLGYANQVEDLSRGPTLTELRTGDFARMGDDGLYRWCGRRSRVAKMFGLRIDLHHLELSLARRGISGHAVQADTRLAVFVEAEADRALAETAEITRLPTHAISVFRLESPPRTSSGKIDHQALTTLALEPVAMHPRGVTVEPTASAADDIRAQFALVLGRPDAEWDDTFTSLEGDSLSYVELGIRLAEMDIGTPPGWQHRTIADLAGSAQPRRLMTHLDTTIVLRAACIIAIVITHTGVTRMDGGAHVLLAVAGFNFARFKLGSGSRRDLWKSRWKSLGVILAPYFAWVISVSILFDAYRPATVLMLNGFLRGHDPDQVRLWFIEVFFWSQVIAILLLAIPAIDRWQRRSPWGVAIFLLVVACIIRFASTGIVAGNELYALEVVGVYFAAGWAAAFAPTRLAQLAISAICIGSTYGLLHNRHRETVVVIGLLILIWIPTVAMPPMLVRPIGAVARASLFIFISHFQFYPAVAEVSPLLATAAAITFGIVFERCWTWGRRWLFTQWSPAQSHALSPS